MKTSSPTRRAILLAGLLSSALPHAAPVFAQGYPARAVKVIVPYSPGSNPDVATRIVMQAMEDRLGQPFVLDTKVGAGGGIGLAAGAKAVPDGYTITVGHVGGLAINPVIYSKLSYDPNKDFVPITQMYNAPLVLLVAADSPYKNVAELLAAAKAKPGEITFSSGGNGNGAHLSGELLNSLAGVSMRHIPYKTVGAALTGVAGGDITFSFGNISLGMPLVQGNKLRALAMSGSSRFPGYPDIPVVSETVKGFEFQDWTGVLAPAGTPPDIVAKLQQEMSAVMAQPQVTSRMQAQGLIPVNSTPAQFRSFIESEQKKWGALAKSIDLKLD